MTMGNLEATIGVNPFGKSIDVDRKPEFIGDVRIEISEKINLVFEEYKKIRLHHFGNFFGAFEHMSHLKLDVLSPQEIDLVLQLIIPPAGIKPLFNYIPGIFVSRLINESYSAGNNNFILTINDYVIDHLFSKVKATEKNPVIATVFGNVGESFGFGSKYCNYVIHGNAGDSCGHFSTYCIYDVAGNAGQILGHFSQRSTYNLAGDAGVQLGRDSSSCTYNINGKINMSNLLINSVAVINSTFKVRDQETYLLLCGNMDPTNKIQLVDKNENIIMEKRKRLP